MLSAILQFPVTLTPEVQNAIHQLLLVSPQIQFFDRGRHACCEVCVTEGVVGESPLCVSIRSSSFSLDRYSHSLFIHVFVAWLKCLFRQFALLFALIAVAAVIRDSEWGTDQNLVSTHLPPSNTEQFARSRAVARAQWNWSECQKFTATRTRTSRKFRAHSISHRNELMWRDCECDYDSQHLSVLDEIDVVSWSSDPVDTSKSTCPLRFRTMSGEDVW